MRNRDINIISMNCLDMKDKIFHFLENNLIGKELVTDAVVYTLANGKLEGIYNDQMIFSNLVRTANGFKFNMTTITHELIYNLDKKGVRTTIAKDYTGTSVFCYELAVRKSTNQLTGYMHCVSTTVQNQTMEAVVCGIFDVIFNGKELSWRVFLHFGMSIREHWKKDYPKMIILHIYQKRYKYNIKILF